MTSIEARKRLERHISVRNENSIPKMTQILEWTEWIYNEIPQKDWYAITFSITVFEKDMVSVGFKTTFVEKFSSAVHDHISMFLRKGNPLSDEPLRAHQTGISTHEFPTVEAFFAAVRADKDFRFACGCVFEEFEIYNGQRPA